MSMELFAKKGIQPVGVREIADHAGILSGSLYTHFKSKLEILDLGMRPYTEIALRDAQEIVEKDTASETKIDELLRVSFARMVEWRTAAAVMHSEWEYMSHLDGFAFVREFNEKVQELWLRALREAIADGTLAPDVDPEIVMRLLREIMGAEARGYSTGRRYSPEVMADYFHRMLFGGPSTPRTVPLEPK